MADYRKIMGLVLKDRSYSDIVDIVGCSRRDVSRVKQIVRAHAVTSIESVSEEDLVTWFPDRRRVADEYEQPDLAGVLAAMKSQRHFTLLMAWRRYADAGGVGKKKYGYSQFCVLFSEYAHTNDLVATLHHEPGRAMFVDWAGDTISVVDQITGEISQTVLFVAVLPYSGALFARAYENMKSPAWLDAHMRALAFFGGVVQLIVPDNPTTSTHPRTKGDRERVINARYQQLADHYGTAIVPARSRRPRDKAAAESAVNVINTRVIGYLEAETWTSLSQLNEAIDDRVAEINHDLVRADDSTRWSRFIAEEQTLLAPLPDTEFEDVVWKECKVDRNYHITVDSGRYSVPFHLAGRLLPVRLTATTVTVFDDHEIVCEHRRLTGRKGQYSTKAEHVPPQHQNIDGLWSRRWFLDRARSFGPATVTIIGDLLDRHTIEAQGYLDCQNILSGLGKNNRARLEAACQELVNRGGVGTYTTIKRIMAAIDSDAKKPSPLRPAASTRRPPTAANDLGPDVYVRDPSHYETHDQEGRQ